MLQVESLAFGFPGRTVGRDVSFSLGAGEASQGPTPAAIANAIRHATGIRLRDLLFTPERVKAALARG